MYGAQIGIFEEMDHEGLCGFLEGLDGLRLPAQTLVVDGEEGDADFADLGGG